MLATIALALATMQPLPETETILLDDGCRLIRKIEKAKVAAKPVARSASAPKPKPRKRLFKTDPKPVDEEVICDEAAPLPPLSVLPPLEPDAPFTPVPPETFERLAAVEPPTPALPPDDEPSAAPAGSFVGIAGPIYGSLPAPLVLVAVTPVSEPAAWLLLAVGFGFIRRKRIV